MLKAAWHRVVTAVSIDPFGEPGSTLLYVGLLSTWASMNRDLMFFPFLWEGLLSKDSEGYKWMNKPLALEMEHLYPQEPCWRTQRGLTYRGL